MDAGDGLFKVPLLSVSHDFCFYGAKGSGKTIVLSYYAFLCYLKGMKVCSNYHLSFPHVFVSSISQLRDMRDCVFVGDDFEAWASSKFFSNSDKKDLLECTLNFRKRNVSPFLWSCKRPLEIDKTLRASSIDFFCRCSLKLKVVPDDIVDYEFVSGFLDSHVVEVEVFSALDLKLKKVVVLDHLDLWVELFDTKEEIAHLDEGF